MPDFGALLSKPAGTAPRPKSLPGGVYPGVIRSKMVGESPKKKTPYVRFMVSPTDWPEDMDPSERDETIDLASKQLRADYYLSDDAMYRLDECLRSLGIEIGPDSSAPEKMYDEAIEEAVGMSCKILLTQDIVEGRDDPVNNVSKLLPAE